MSLSENIDAVKDSAGEQPRPSGIMLGPRPGTAEKLSGEPSETAAVSEAMDALEDTTLGEPSTMENSPNMSDEVEEEMPGGQRPSVREKVQAWFGAKGESANTDQESFSPNGSRPSLTAKARAWFGGDPNLVSEPSEPGAQHASSTQLVAEAAQPEGGVIEQLAGNEDPSSQVVSTFSEASEGPTRLDEAREWLNGGGTASEKRVSGSTISGVGALAGLAMFDGGTTASMVGAYYGVKGALQRRADKNELVTDPEELEALLLELQEILPKLIEAHSQLTHTWRGPLSLFGTRAEEQAAARGVDPTWILVARRANRLAEQATDVKQHMDDYIEQLLRLKREESDARYVQREPVRKIIERCREMTPKIISQLGFLKEAHAAFDRVKGTPLGETPTTDYLALDEQEWRSSELPEMVLRERGSLGVKFQEWGEIGYGAIVKTGTRLRALTRAEGNEGNTAEQDEDSDDTLYVHTVLASGHPHPLQKVCRDPLLLKRSQEKIQDELHENEALSLSSRKLELGDRVVGCKDDVRGQVGVVDKLVDDEGEFMVAFADGKKSGYITASLFRYVQEHEAYNEDTKSWPCAHKCTSCTREEDGASIRWFCKELEISFCRGCVEDLGGRTMAADCTPDALARTASTPKFMPPPRPTINKHLLLTLRGDLFSEVSETRISAARELGRLGDVVAVEDLRDVLKNDASDEVREAAATSLGLLRDPAALLDLVEALDHAPIRHKVAKALEHLGDPATAYIIYSVKAKDDERLATELAKFKESYKNESNIDKESC